MLAGRLGLVKTNLAHKDRHGLLYLEHGTLKTSNGGVVFESPGSENISPGQMMLPFERLSILLLGPGVSVTHDVFRILGRHKVLVQIVGEQGVKFYSAIYGESHKSALARVHAELWVDESTRLKIARRMYAMRFGQVLPHRDIEVLRGIEGGRMKEAYRLLAAQYQIKWSGRRFDRKNPGKADIPNQAINHAQSFVKAAAEIAVNATGAIPSLGFIHEHTGMAFILDIADLFRTSTTIPIAFKAAKTAKKNNKSIESITRLEAVQVFKQERVIEGMIDKIKELIDNDTSGDNERIR